MSHKKILSSDPKMKMLLSKIPANRLQVPQKSLLVREELIGSIVSQQLSIKVAPIIFNRFLDLYGGKIPVNQKIIDTDHQRLRDCGLSNHKAQYIKNIAAFFEEHKIKNSTLKKMSDKEVIETLTQIKGVGRWTVEMVLIFCLGRPDVFSVGDYGIQTSMKELYKIRKEKKELEKKMLSLAEKWKPFRTTACLYLWAYKDLKIKT